jgi:hypothetical protein
MQGIRRVDPEAVIVDVKIEDVLSLPTAASTTFTHQPHHRLNQQNRVRRCPQISESDLT